jgi:hypothetical protein
MPALGDPDLPDGSGGSVHVGPGWAIQSVDDGPDLPIVRGRAAIDRRGHRRRHNGRRDPDVGCEPIRQGDPHRRLHRSDLDVRHRVGIAHQGATLRTRRAQPGDVVQSVSLSTGGSSSQTTSGFVASNVSGTITPTSTINPIRVRMTAAIMASANSGGNELIGTQVYRGISGSFTAIGQQYNTGLASPGAGSSYQGNVISLPSDLPGTTSPVTYTLYFNSAAPGHTVSVFNGEGELIEIMGALEPANDDAAPLRLVG